MERTSIARIDEDLDRCLNLCWKGMYIEAEWDPTVQHGNDRAFWCQKTFRPLGPDGNPVDEYECNETRGCYVPL
ncbi:MAG: hypothetical protein MUC42_18040 [Bryobacter sp.]|nr:hypothetical protein [Bryobacter sp.]